MIGYVSTSNFTLNITAITWLSDHPVPPLKYQLPNSPFTNHYASLSLKSAKTLNNLSFTSMNLDVLSEKNS